VEIERVEDEVILETLDADALKEEQIILHLEEEFGISLSGHALSSGLSVRWWLDVVEDACSHQK
jgi:acyl carrier protein